MFTSSIKREIRHFPDVVVQWRQRNVQKSVMHVQSFCLPIQRIAFLTFSLSSQLWHLKVLSLFASPIFLWLSLELCVVIHICYNLYWYRMTLQQKMMTKVMTMMMKRWSPFSRRINTAWVPWRRWSRSWRCWLRNRDVKGVYSYLSWSFCRFGRAVKLHQWPKGSRRF